MENWKILEDELGLFKAINDISINPRSMDHSSNEIPYDELTTEQLQEHCLSLETECSRLERRCAQLEAELNKNVAHRKAISGFFTGLGIRLMRFQTIEKAL